MERKLSNTSVEKQESEDYFKRREDLVTEDKKNFFIVDVPELTEEEHKAELKLTEMKDKLLVDGKLPHLNEYYESKPIFESSDLYKSIIQMPKGGHLHLHLTAAAHLDFLLDLTKKDIVYYSETHNKIKIFPNGDPEEGYSQ